MKIRNLIALGATGMVATSAAVWYSSAPARAAITPPAVAPAPAPTPTPPPTPPVPLADHSHFTAGKTLLMEGRFGHMVLPADTDSESFLFVDVTSDKTLKAAAPPPLDLAIAIDRSGSMKGKRLDNAFAAARSAVDRLRDGDIVSVVTYNSASEVLVSPTVIDAASRKRITAELAEPKAMGETCISCAVETSMRLLGEQSGRTDLVQRILLVSDGFADVGVRDVPGFRRIADEARRMGASISTIGVDVDFDERIMTALARDSNGKHFFVEHPDALASILDGEMDRLGKTVANGAELVVDLAPGVEAEQVFDRATDSIGSQVVVPLGAFATGDEKTLLIRVRVPRSAAGERTIASVHLRYDDLVNAKQGECDGEVETQFSTDPSAVTPLDALVSARVSQSETAEALEQANDLFRNGNTTAANQVIQQQQMNMHMRMMEADKVAPMDRGAAVDDSFTKQDMALNTATGGFAAAAAPTTTTTEGKAEAAHAAKKAEKDNAQNAFDASE